MRRSREEIQNATNARDRVITLTPYFMPAFRGGGPIRSLRALVRAAPDDVVVAVATSDHDLGAQAPLAVERNCWTSVEGIQCYYAATRNCVGLLRFYLAILRWQPSIIYLNGFFGAQFTILPLILRRFGWCSRAGVLLAPRGEFSPGALAIKPRKKQIYLASSKLLNLSRGVVWHASSPSEADDIRSVFGPTTEILIRENETSLPGWAELPAAGCATPLMITFLSRISVKKGLDILLRALKSVETALVLDIYGPEEDTDYSLQCHALARDLPNNITVTFKGPVAGDDVRSVLAKYALFALPTAGENFGHVIAEALSVACPVMCTHQTPWTERLNSGGGVVVDSRTTAAWSTAITAYARLTPRERSERRLRAAEVYNEWHEEEKGPHIFDLMKNSSIAR